VIFKGNTNGTKPPYCGGDLAGCNVMILDVAEIYYYDIHRPGKEYSMAMVK
jgi:hypothetical protein